MAAFLQKIRENAAANGEDGKKIRFNEFSILL
jgi:hypothetical protein